MKPIIVFVDDKPQNLTVFEAALPEDWEIHTFDNPLSALDKIEEIRPMVILSDQRMPQTTGVRFLELAAKLCPEAVRIIVTGFSDEDLVVESVRKAKIYDYIRKPWDPDDLEQSILKAVEHYEINQEKDKLVASLKVREAELSAKTVELEGAKKSLEQSLEREREAYTELKSWVPPFVLWALSNGIEEFPIRRDLIVITFDIVNSHRLHGIEVEGVPIRGKIIQNFSESLIRHGGWRESHSGDSCYGHFGLEVNQTEIETPFEAALAVASDLKTALRNLTRIYKIAPIECGIAIHVAKRALVEVHEVHLRTPSGLVTQKSFDTSSIDIDIVHKMEKSLHSLPGTNVIVSEDFARGLREMPKELKELGEMVFLGKNESIKTYVIPSDQVEASDIEKLNSTLSHVLKKDVA